MALRSRLARICCWSAAGERHLRHRGVTLRREELALAEAERYREEEPRQALHRGVEVHHGRVVIAARGADLVLGVRQVFLELQEVLGRLQVRIRLGDREEPADRRGEELVRVRCVPGRRGLLHGCSRPRHLVEDGTLVSGIAADGLDEVRDQVGAALELDFDVRPTRLDLVAQPDQPVVAVHRDEDE
jgi:hypothetical protein